METLRNYLESMFERYPHTQEAEKAKAELWQMMEDKYNELLADGTKENEAVGIVISEFGDLEEVADSLGISTMLQRVDTPAENTGSAKQEAAGEQTVSGGPTLVFGETPESFTSAAEERRAFADEAARQAFGTAGSEYKSAESAGQAESTWQQTEASGERTGAWWNWHNAEMLQGSSGENTYRIVTGVLSVYWPTVTCLYLCWSFLTFHWWITWIIWPLAAVLHSVLKRLILGDVTASEGHVYKSRLIAAVLESYWPCVVFVYFAVSFLTGTWPISWLIFVIAPFMHRFLKRMATEEGVVEA
ncbi:MAG: permease prefix domain 1-containing protein [Lachnospiraceae bacterium]|nr:permease prefix domain 1-containing protein [Lachnospiraceae bacterium]